MCALFSGNLFSSLPLFVPSLSLIISVSTSSCQRKWARPLVESLLGTCLSLDRVWECAAGWQMGRKNLISARNVGTSTRQNPQPLWLRWDSYTAAPVILAFKEGLAAKKVFELLLHCATANHCSWDSLPELVGSIPPAELQPKTFWLH